MATARKVHFIRINGIAASRDFGPGQTAQMDRALDQAIAARPDAVISLVQAYGDKEIGEFIVHNPA